MQINQSNNQSINRTKMYKSWKKFYRTYSWPHDPISSFVPMSLYLMDSLVVLIVIAMTLSTLAHVFYRNSKNKLPSQISQTDFHFFRSDEPWRFGQWSFQRPPSWPRNAGAGISGVWERTSWTSSRSGSCCANFPARLFAVPERDPEKRVISPNQSVWCVENIALD